MPVSNWHCTHASITHARTHLICNNLFAISFLSASSIYRLYNFTYSKLIHGNGWVVLYLFIWNIFELLTGNSLLNVDYTMCWCKVKMRFTFCLSVFDFLSKYFGTESGFSIWTDFPIRNTVTSYKINSFEFRISP